MAEVSYLYVLKPTRVGMLIEGPTDAEAVVLGQHVDYLSRLADQNRVMLAGRTQTSDAATFGLVLFVADSEAQATRIMQADPAVEQGVMSATLHPYKVAVLGRDWRRAHG